MFLGKRFQLSLDNCCLLSKLFQILIGKNTKFQYEPKFSRVLCIMSYNHKVEWSIKNIPASYVQIARNNPPETPKFVKERKLAFHTARRSLLVGEFLAKNTNLAPCDLFMFPKLKRHTKRSTIRYNWENKDDIENGTKQDHKKWFFVVLQGLEKSLAQVLLYLVGTKWIFVNN